MAADEVDDTLMPHAGKRKSGANEGRGRKKTKPSQPEDVSNDVIFPEEVPRQRQVNWCPITHPDMSHERLPMVKSNIELTREERDKQIEDYCKKVGRPNRTRRSMCVLVGLVGPILIYARACIWNRGFKTSCNTMREARLRLAGYFL